MIIRPNNDTNKEGVLITPSILKHSKLDGFGHEIHSLDKAIVVMSDEMEAMELIHVAQALHKLSTELLNYLAKKCGSCGGCQECWGKSLEDQSFQLPDWVYKASGISREDPLVCEIDKGKIMLFKRNYEGIEDIPEEIVALFTEAGWCIGELYEKVLSGEIVYSDE